MEYKKDKRTKNLTLRDIHVGDWVQVWSEQTERYSPPLKIISIHDDGTIYLVTSDEERCTPFEENIKNVDALEITEEVLLGFGFKKYRNNFFYEGNNFIYNLTYNQLSPLTLKPIKYFHEMQNVLDDDYCIKFNWKGVEK